jgi:superoxide dismutase, Cu-Zn family
MRKSAIFALFTLLSFVPSAAHAAAAQAVVQGTSQESTISGTVLFEDTAEGLKVKADVKGLTPGKHAFHIHEYGDCSDSGNAAGSHYNPDNAPHGLLHQDGPGKAHAGDMGNLEADASGNASLETSLPGTVLTGEKGVAGRAVIVHEKEDDFGQPTGNAGGRTGCGTIALTKAAS